MVNFTIANYTHLLNEQTKLLEEFLRHCAKIKVIIESIQADEYTKSGVCYYLKQAISTIERLINYLVILKEKLKDLS